MTVKIQEKEYGVTFNMAVQIRYEELSGQPFDINNMETQKATMQLCFASLQEANENLPFDFNGLMKILNVTEIENLKDAVIKTTAEWFKIPAVVSEETEETPDDEDPKNA